MRESSQSLITFTLHKGEPVLGETLMRALEDASDKPGFQVYDLLWQTHYHDDHEWQRPRILRKQDSRRATGNPKYSYGFFITESFKLCRPLVIDPHGEYPSLYLAVDSWGVNFNNLLGTQPDFVDGCRARGKQLSIAISGSLKQAIAA